MRDRRKLPVRQPDGSHWQEDEAEWEDLIREQAREQKREEEWLASVGGPPTPPTLDLAEEARPGWYWWMAVSETEEGEVRHLRVIETTAQRAIERAAVWAFERGWEGCEVRRVERGEWYAPALLVEEIKV